MSNYLFAVFTHWTVNPFERENISRIVDIVGQCKKIDSAILILESGANGDNAHLNLIVHFPEGQSNTSYFRKLCKGYYGKSGIPRNALVCKTVDNLPGLLNYLSKEPSSECVYQTGEFRTRDHEAAKRGYVPPPAVEPRAMFQMITRRDALQAMEDYIVKHDYRITNYSDFMQLIKDMKRDKLVMLDVLSRPKHFYALLLDSEDSNDKLDQILTENGNLN